MQITMKKVIAVANDFELLDEVLKKAFTLAEDHQASVEVLYVHESPFFEIPDFFHSETNATAPDKEKIKASIIQKIQSIDPQEMPAVFVEIDDTPDRVWALVRDDKEVLLVAAYHQEITKKLISKVSQPLLVLKSHTENYTKAALIINASSTCKECIEKVNFYFPQTDMELIYDYRSIVDPQIEIFDPQMQAGLQNAQIIEEAQKDAFEALKKESGLEGEFFIDGDCLGTQMNTYLQDKNFDILYVCSHGDDFFASDDLSLALLDDVDCDILID